MGKRRVADKTIYPEELVATEAEAPEDEPAGEEPEVNRLNDGVERTLRTLVQLVAAGGLTWLTEALANDLPPGSVPYMLGVYTVLVTLCQNAVEEWTGKGLLKPKK